MRPLSETGDPALYSAVTTVSVRLTTRLASRALGKNCRATQRPTAESNGPRPGPTSINRPASARTSARSFAQLGSPLHLLLLLEITGPHALTTPGLARAWSDGGNTT